MAEVLIMKIIALKIAKETIIIDYSLEVD